MESFSFFKKLKHHLLVNPGSLEEATDYYVEVFGAVLKKGFLSFEADNNTRCVELFLADTTLFISEGIKEDSSKDNQIRIEVTSYVDEVKSLALRHENAEDYSGTISEQEAARGILAKILDPYGYIWALSQLVVARDICKLCYCTSPVHMFDSLCTHPKTLAWIKQDSHMPSSSSIFSTDLKTKYTDFIATCNEHVNTRSEDFETKAYHCFPSRMEFMINVYRFMVVIRWARLVRRFSTKEIEIEFEFAAEKLDRVLSIVHTRLEGTHHFDILFLERWKNGVESVQKLLKTILAKIGFKEGMNDSINEELGHWNGLLADIA